MFKGITKYLVVSAVLFSIFAIPSCKKDETISTEISIYYKNRTIDLEDDETSASIKFTAYTEWYISIDDEDTSWLSVNAYAGTTGSFEITCFATENDSLGTRSGSICFHGTNQTNTVAVNQKGRQIIEFEDDNFEKYCIENFDKDTNGYVTTAEAHKAKKVDCPNMGIADFSGLEHFKNITELDISGNDMVTATFEKMASVKKISCYDCPNLTAVSTSYEMTALTYMNCSNCRLQSLMLDSCSVLSELNCSSNDFRSLNVSLNSALKFLDCTNNPKMTTIFMDREQSLSSLKKDESTQIVYPDQIIEIPDANFKAYILSEYDVNRDGEISVEESMEVRYIHCQGKKDDVRDIKTLKGTEYFPNITELDCSWCNVESLDFTYNTKLQYIYCTDNENLKSVKISSLSPLLKFNCSNCINLTELNLNRNTHLGELVASGCALESIDFTQCTALKDLYLSNNRLTNLTLTSYPLIKYIDCSHNQLTGTLTILDCDSLAYVYCNDNMLDSVSLDADDLYDVDCSSNNLYFEKLDIAHWKYLHTFACENNAIDTLVLPFSANMVELNAQNCKIKKVDLSGLPNLRYAYLDGNLLDTVTADGCVSLERLFVENNALEGEISFSSFRELKMLRLRENADLKSIWAPKGVEEIEILVDDGVEVKYR